MTLAHHQAPFLKTAIGYSKTDANLQHRYVRPINDKERQLCHSQVSQSPMLSACMLHERIKE